MPGTSTASPAAAAGRAPLAVRDDGLHAEALGQHRCVRLAAEERGLVLSGDHEVTALGQVAEHRRGLTVAPETAPQVDVERDADIAGARELERALDGGAAARRERRRDARQVEPARPCDQLAGRGDVAGVEARGSRAAPQVHDLAVRKRPPVACQRAGRRGGVVRQPADVDALAAQDRAHHLPETVRADAAHERDGAVEPCKAHRDVGLGSGHEGRERRRRGQRPALVRDQCDERLAERDDVGAHASACTSASPRAPNSEVSQSSHSRASNSMPRRARRTRSRVSATVVASRCVPAG